MIAIIGMAGRFPGAPDLPAYWDLLANGREGFVRLADNDLLSSGVPRATFSDPRYVPAAAVLDGIDRFDAGFWSMSGHEASMMDPQQRILLELAWHALEDAAIDPARTDASIGVFVGTAVSTYLMFQLRDRISGPSAPSQLLAMVGNDKDYIATQLAYRLDLRGPAIAVQTACSSSLVAVHLACQSLLSGECDIAIAGGVSVRVPHRVGYLHEEGGMLSPDGHCRSFADDAAGTVFGSGAGLVVLRRADEAGKDRVRALLLGSAVNNDGSRKVGFTAPSQDRQAAVIAEAMAVAGVRPADIGCIEGHGTATPLGDPVEVAALATACRGAARGAIALGSAKSNIGHTETAAGVAGLIKSVLMLEHATIARSLHADAPSKRIEWDKTPLRLARETRSWTERLVAGVSSFGIGGTNAHVVLGRAPAAKARPTASRLVISARDKAALAQLTEAYRQRLGAEPAAFGQLAGAATRRPRHALWIEAASVAALTSAVPSDGPRPTVEASGDGAPAELPLYPFQRQRHWVEPHPDLLGPAIATPFDETVHQVQMTPARLALLEQHVVDGTSLLPGALHLALFSAIAAPERLTLADVSILRPLPVDSATDLQLWRAPNGRLRVMTCTDGTWQTLAEAATATADAAGAAWVHGDGQSIDGAVWTATMREAGLAFGPAFRLIDRLHCGVREVSAEIAPDRPRDIIAILDAGLQALGAAAIGSGNGFRPTSLGRFTIHRSIGDTCRILARIVDDNSEAKTGDVMWLDRSDTVVAEARAVVCRRVQSSVDRMIYQLVCRPDDPPTATPYEALEELARVFARDALASVAAPARPALATLLRPHADAADPTITSVAAAIEELTDAFPDHAVEIALVARCGQALPDVLAGRRDPLDVLFNDDSGARGAYRASPLARRLNRAAASVAAAARPRRVIEIGGGTAATTQALREVLPATVDYLFTDISPAFLAAAERTFAGWLNLRTATLDISRPPALQDMEVGTFDLVVAANVLHATPDLAAAVRNAVTLLAPGGRLLLIEGTGPLARLDITFGLTDHWTRRDDHALRPDHPLVAAETWRDLLRDVGLDDIAIVAEGSGQIVLVAQAGRQRWVAVGRDASLARSLGLDLVPVGAQLPANNLEGVVCLAGLENSVALPDLLGLSQALISRADTPRLLVPMRAPPSPAAAALRGFARTLAREHPALRPRSVACEGDSLATALAVERALDDGEDSTLWRVDKRHVERLMPFLPTEPPAPTRRLGIDLQALPIDRPVPGPGEVLIRVRAAGINYKDALAVAGQVPMTGIGSECAGEVEALGPGVSGITVGAEVIAVAAGALATHVCADARLVVPKPAHLTFAEAAAAPIAGATAWHALREVARLQPGERVLIHSATGGVGWFAVQIARSLGAEIVATAGNEAKRRLLVAAGIQDVFSSRDVGFLAAGKVDVVLNALPASQRDASLQMLRPGGRFVEIGRVGIATPEEITTRRPDVAYSVVALDQIEIPRFATLLRAIVEAVAADRTLLPPLETMGLSRAQQGFASMMRSEHIGKLVALPELPATIRNDGTYVVTGGMGGLGPWIADWLRRRGAGGVIRVGRTAPAEAMDEAVVGDVANPATLEAVELRVRQLGLPSVRGVIHAAGILEDRLITGIDRSAFDRVAAAKLGGLNAIVERWPDLELLVGFSSAGALFGSAGQATHTASSAALDAALMARANAGYPAMTIDWGAWRDHGAAARHGVAADLAAGMGSIGTPDGFAALDRILAAGLSLAAVLPMDPIALRATNDTSPLLRDLMGETCAAPPGILAAPPPTSDSSPAERRTALRDRIAQECSEMLSIRGAIEHRRPLQELGLDSLAALELRNRLGRLVGTVLPASLLFDHPTVAALTEHLATAYLGLPSGKAALPPDAMTQAPVSLQEEDLAQASEADLDAALDAFAVLLADPMESR